MLIAIAVSLSPDKLLALVYGEQYGGYGNVLRWYALCYVLMFFNLPLRSGLRVLEASRPIFIAYVLMTMFTILFAGILVEQSGVDGAGAGVVVTQMISLSCLFYFFQIQLKKINVNLVDSP